MGEYAKRKDNGYEVKIGTCEAMYYLRFEDRTKVEKLHGSLDPMKSKQYGLSFRLPFPDEDVLGAGHINGAYNRGEPLPEFKGDETTLNTAGNIQLVHSASGLLANVSCYHGQKLPINSEDTNFHWNGKGYSFELVRVKHMEDGRVIPLVQCRHCHTLWRADWDEILPYITDERLKERCEAYQLVSNSYE